MQKILLVTALILTSLHGGAFYADTDARHYPSAENPYYETIIMHTDRDLYIAGERLYFRLDIFNNTGDPVSRIAYISLRNQDNTLINNVFIFLEENTGFGSIYLSDTLGSSVYQLVAFTNWMRNSGQEHFAENQVMIVNRFDEELDFLNTANPEKQDGKNAGSNCKETIPDYIPGHDSKIQRHGSVSISPLKNKFGTREKVQIELVPSLSSGSVAYLSLSVTQKETLFESDTPYYDTDIRSVMRGERTQGESYFFKETDGPVISGRVTEKNSRKGIANTNVILNSPDTTLNLLYTRTMADGTFHFRLNGYHEGKELHLSLFDRDALRDAEISTDNKFRLEQHFQPDIVLPGKATREFIKTSQDIVRINKTLGIDLNIELQRERYEYVPAIYSAPAYTFSQFSEYEYMSDMQEIARELLTFLRIRKRGNEYTSTLMLEYSDTYLQDTPVYFLDGIFTDDINRIIHLDSDDLKKIDFHNYRWRHGDILFPGIVSIYSNNHEYRNMQLSEPSVSIEHPPAASPSFYRPPDYEKDKNIVRSRPDFRQLLFWEPEIILENNDTGSLAEFFSGDLKGEFIIRARGFTSDGEIIDERASIMITDSGTELYEKDSVSPVRETGVIERSSPGRLTAHDKGGEKKLHRDTASDEYFEQGLSGKMNITPRRPIGDQHYPAEEWLTGDVLLENGNAIKNKLLRYNGYLDELFWLYEGDYQQIQVDKNMISEFTLHTPAGTQARFRRIGVYSPILIGKDEIFAEILYEGHVSVYSCRRVIETTRGDYRVGDKLIGGIKIKPGHLYIFRLPDNTIRIIQKIRRRNILNLFPDQRREIRRLMREKRLRPRNEKELVEAAKVLEDFFRETR